MRIIIRLCRQFTIFKFNNDKCEKQKKNKLQQNSLHGLVASSRSVNYYMFYKCVFKLTSVVFLKMGLHFVMHSCSLSYEFMLSIVKIIGCVLSLRSSQ